MRKLILILIMQAAMGAMAQDLKPESQDLKHAEYLVNNEMRWQAYETLATIIKDNPGCARAYYLRAICHLADANTKTAMQDINAAISREPLNQEYLWQKCLILKAIGKMELSAQYLAKALQPDPSAILSSDSHKATAAEIMVANGNTIDALPIINSIEERQATFHRVRGMAYAKAQMNDYAIADLSQAIDLDPSLADCYIWRGLARYQNGDSQAARADWEHALRKGIYEARKYLEKYK